MVNYKKSIILLIIVLFSASFILRAEDGKSFKTGLVLSGGGAKGLAHIGLLQLIDSLDIQIDYITGTSMGAIVGALYASGYSADDINSIIHEINWDYILSNRIPLDKVHIFEKNDFGKNIVSLPIKKRMPLMPGALIDGQYLTDEMSRFFFHTRNINDFSDLPIPLEVIATDILSGKTVKLNQGSIPIAIRASMAIPGFFTSVHWGEYLLVDGGMTRNFPVEEVRDMGADIVIGSYTGMRIRTQEEVENAFNTIVQSFAFNAVSDAQKQMNLTDILLDFSTSLFNYETQTFSAYEDIIEIGKEQAYQILPQLIALKEKQQVAGIDRTRKKMLVSDRPIRDINTFDVYSNPLPEKEHKTILALLKTEHKQQLDNYEYLSEKISNIYSYFFYSKIHYYFSNNDDGTKDLNIFVKPIKKKLKVALHYDTYESAGIVLKFIQNNLWLNNSKFIFATDLSQYGKIDIAYKKFLTDKLNIWGELEYNNRNQIFNNVYFKMVSQMLHHTKSTVQNSTEKLKLSFGYAPNIYSAFTLSADYQYNQINKNNGLFSSFFFQDEVSTSLLPLYVHNQMALTFRYEINSLNSSYYPIKGIGLNFQFGWLHNTSYNFNKPHDRDKVGQDFYMILNPALTNRKIYNDVLNVSLNAHWALPIGQRISLHNYFFSGMNFVKKDNKIAFVNTSDYLFMSQMFALGGYHNYDYDRQIPFAGFGINEFHNNGVMALSTALQWNVWKKLYITPRLSVGATLAHPNPFDKSELNEWTVGGGVDIDYRTPLGPIKFAFGVNDQVGVPVAFLSFGYQF